jgi:hypothetical protein
VTFATIEFYPRHSRDGVAAKFLPYLLREGAGGGVPIAQAGGYPAPSPFLPCTVRGDVP